MGATITMVGGCPSTDGQRTLPGVHRNLGRIIHLKGGRTKPMSVVGLHSSSELQA
ncbi:MAG: hypothetical protein ACLRH0_13095 [Blautia wexlerae]